MKIIIISISFAALFSCNKNEKPAIHITEDAYLKKYEQIPSTSLSKISLNSYIDLDTIETNIVKHNIPILNTGRKTIKDLYLKTTCDCTTVNDYKKTLFPNEGDTLKIAIDVSKENGYFSKKVILYGNFYPYKRIIEVIGFKK